MNIQDSHQNKNAQPTQQAQYIQPAHQIEGVRTAQNVQTNQQIQNQSAYQVQTSKDTQQAQGVKTAQQNYNFLSNNQPPQHTQQSKTTEQLTHQSQASSTQQNQQYQQMQKGLQFEQTQQFKELVPTHRERDIVTEDPNSEDEEEDNHSHSQAQKHNEQHTPHKGEFATSRQENTKIQPSPKKNKNSNILFYFDFQNKKFHYYNIQSSAWESNDLDYCKDDCPRCPLWKFKNKDEGKDAIQFVRYMNAIAYSEELVFLIGGYNSYYSCLEYNVTQNKFYCRKPIEVFRNNPTLCVHGDNIYAISGDLLDTFSNHVSAYNVQTNEWTALPELPEPQGFCSVSMIGRSKGAQGQGSTNNSKLAVLGGLEPEISQNLCQFVKYF